MPLAQRSVKQGEKEAALTVQSQKVFEEALALPPIERASLIDELLASFDFPSRHEVDALWAKEVEDRIDAYERGNT